MPEENTLTLPSSPAYDVKHIAAGGLFHNSTIGDSPRVSMDYVSSKDGTSTTLMFAENLQAGTWNLDPQLLDKELPADLNKPYAARDKLAARAKAMTTFVWWGDVDNNGNPPDLSRSPDLPEKTRLGLTAATSTTPLPIRNTTARPTPMPCGSLGRRPSILAASPSRSVTVTRGS